MKVKVCDFCGAPMVLDDPHPVLLVPRPVKHPAQFDPMQAFAAQMGMQTPERDVYDLCLECARTLTTGVAWVRMQARGRFTAPQG